ncbi:unnamed protein product, partial [Prorocentrum cordatum]
HAEAAHASAVESLAQSQMETKQEAKQLFSLDEYRGESRREERRLVEEVAAAAAQRAAADRVALVPGAPAAGARPDVRPLLLVVEKVEALRGLCRSPRPILAPWENLSLTRGASSTTSSPSSERPPSRCMRLLIVMMKICPMLPLIWELSALRSCSSSRSARSSNHWRRRSVIDWSNYCASRSTRRPPRGPESRGRKPRRPSTAYSSSFRQVAISFLDLQLSPHLYLSLLLVHNEELFPRLRMREEARHFPSQAARPSNRRVSRAGAWIGRARAGAGAGPGLEPATARARAGARNGDRSQDRGFSRVAFLQHYQLDCGFIVFCPEVETDLRWVLCLRAQAVQRSL